MTIPKDLLRNNPGLGKWAILVGYRGSIAHNCFIPIDEPMSTDDVDVMAVCMPPNDYYHGLKRFGSRGRGTQEISHNEWDIVIYEVHKFIQLLAKGNPNVLMMLWLRDNHYIKRTRVGDMLIENRDMFVGRHVYKSFVGYAHGQLKRMEAFNKQGHMGARRRELMEKYSYDPINAAHLIRLLRMGCEFLKDGELNVFRHDAPQLIEIKRGKWSLEQVKAESDRLFKLAEETYLASTLPAKPDMDDIHELTMAMFGSRNICACGTRGFYKSDGIERVPGKATRINKPHDIRTT